VIITYKTITKIKFPVFQLPNSNWSTQDGLMFIDREIVDDKNMRGDTLGLRRLQSPFTMMKLNRSVNNIVGILKQPRNTFIDSTGTPFIYQKTLFVTLKYLKITKIVRRDVAALVYVKGCNSPFTVPRPPADDMRWAGVLHLHGFPWELYEYSESYQKDTRRKI
jgi:hypothetical protein